MSDKNWRTDELIWKRIDDHGAEISRLREDAAAQKVRLDALEQRTDKLLETLSEVRTEAQANYTKINRGISELDKHLQRAKGGLRVGLWFAGVVGTIIAFIVSVWSVITKGSSM